MTSSGLLVVLVSRFLGLPSRQNSHRNNIGSMDKNFMKTGWHVEPRAFFNNNWAVSSLHLSKSSLFSSNTLQNYIKSVEFFSFTPVILADSRQLLKELSSCISILWRRASSSLNFITKRAFSFLKRSWNSFLILKLSLIFFSSRWSSFYFQTVWDVEQTFKNSNPRVKCSRNL